MRQKYPIHPDFKRWSHLHPPLYGALLPAIQFFLRRLYPPARSDRQIAASWLRIPTADGGTMRAIRYAPKQLADPAPALVLCHGGGFVFPAAPNHFRLAREYARRANCIVLLFDYRLAPKHPFPAAPVDCYAAYRFVLEHASQLSIDPSRVAVAGDSAGGELATGICLMARARGERMPCAQMLLYPAVGFDTDTPSMAQFTDTPMCNSRDAQKYDAFYLKNGIPAGMEQYASPLGAAALSGLPPAYIETAEFDCLRDGAIQYAERLRDAGVPTQLHNTKGTIHGFDVVKNSGIVADCLERRGAFLRTHLWGANVPPIA